MRNESTDILRFHDVTTAADREYKSSMGNRDSSRAAGALAVALWTTNELQVWSHPTRRATARWRMPGSSMGVTKKATG